MKAESAPQPIPDQFLAPHSDEPHHRLFCADEPLPKVCRIEDLCRIFNVVPNTVSHWILDGELDRFELMPRIGKRAWSGTLLQRYVDAEPGASRFVVRATARKGGAR